MKITQRARDILADEFDMEIPGFADAIRDGGADESYSVRAVQRALGAPMNRVVIDIRGDFGMGVVFGGIALGAALTAASTGSGSALVFAMMCTVVFWMKCSAEWRKAWGAPHVE